MLDWHAARALALSLPEAQERDHFGSPSFRVEGKIFAQLSAQGDDELRALVKLTKANQTRLTSSEPDTFSSAPHWGRHGWTYIQLAGVEESVLRSLLIQSWRLVASKKLGAMFEARISTLS